MADSKFEGVLPKRAYVQQLTSCTASAACEAGGFRGVRRLEAGLMTPPFHQAIPDGQGTQNRFASKPGSNISLEPTRRRRHGLSTPRLAALVGVRKRNCQSRTSNLELRFVA